MQASGTCACASNVAWREARIVHCDRAEVQRAYVPLKVRRRFLRERLLWVGLLLFFLSANFFLFSYGFESKLVRRRVDRPQRTGKVRLESVARTRPQPKLVKITTLGGGSLGSCVDEERSQLRELM